MKLRGALLGAGNIALRGHAPQWNDDPLLREAVEIVAVADLAPANLELARSVLPAARMYATAEALLDREALDFCDICTPPFTHRPLVTVAGARGLHVVCEKPIAPHLKDAEAMADTVRGTGIIFVPCHQYHHSPQWQKVTRLLPRIGRAYLAEYEVQRTEANPGNPHWTPTWRTDRSLAGGGILFDHGAHICYQLRTVLGDPDSVQATVRTLRHKGYGVEDSAFVVLDYRNGVAQVQLTWAARHREIRFRFLGEGGELIGNDERILVRAETSEEIAFDDGMSKNSSHSEWYAPLFRDFVERVRRNDRSTDALDEAVSVARLITRAYESSDSGRMLPLVGAVPAVVERAVSAVSAAISEPSGSAEAAPASVSETATEEAAKRTPWGVRAAAMGLLVAAVSWAAHDVRWSDLFGVIRTSHPTWIAVATLVNLAAIFTMAGRWFAILEPLSPRVTWLESFKAMIMGYAVSTVVPARAGELARAEWLGRNTGLPRVSVIGSILLDHLVNAVGLFAGLALLPLVVDIPSWLRPGAALAVVVFALAAAVVFFLRPHAVGAVQPVAMPRRAGMIGSAVARALGHARLGVAALRDRRALGVSFGLSLVAWVLEIGVILAALRAFQIQVPLAASFLVLIAVNLALVVPFAPPANLGTLELGATLALMEFGVHKEQALAFALCYHLLQVIPIGVGA